MTVSELITYLLAQPQDAQVAYSLYSDQCLMEFSDICLMEACEPRPDGWVQRRRQDMPTQVYLLFPGN